MAGVRGLATENVLLQKAEKRRKLKQLSKAAHRRKRLLKSFFRSRILGGKCLDWQHLEDMEGYKHYKMKKRVGRYLVHYFRQKRRET